MAVKPISVRLTQDELWQVLNSMSQAPATDDADFKTAHDKLAIAHLKMRRADQTNEVTHG